mmetsp:Transcript_1187/g.1776  ORF Transcript_1187/g.1776 Transcript_1187/m.1776 type:complete len:256 (+) Transcript_1187:185-952(+)
MDGTKSFGGVNATTLGYGLLYFFCSASMLLFNKLAIYHYQAPAFICLIQYAFCVVAVYLLKFLNFVEVDPLSWETVKKYWPVPALFSCAIFSNNKILQYANIETFIVVRNTTPLFVAILDFFVMGKSLPSKRSLGCFGLIILGTFLFIIYYKLLFIIYYIYMRNQVKIAYAYKNKETGERLPDGAMPSTLEELAMVEPEYETLPGWKQDITNCQTYDDLPENAKVYVSRIEELVGCPVSWIGVGAKREQMVTKGF